jgi:L-alanine-DL-glutamate epimerase-like enolase superfamily enzyme
LKKELSLIQKIREKYNSKEVIIRVDANGAFSFEQAKNVLLKLKELDVHSIEQPIKSGQLQQMKELCEFNIVPIALDEELIGIIEKETKFILVHI